MFNRIDLHTEGIQDMGIRVGVSFDFIGKDFLYRVSQPQLLKIIEAHYKKVGWVK